MHLLFLYAKWLTLLITCIRMLLWERVQITHSFPAYPQLYSAENHSFLFHAGLLYVTAAGNYILKLVDMYASGWNVIIICILETTFISYVYGYARFAKVSVSLG